MYVCMYVCTYILYACVFVSNVRWSVYIYILYACVFVSNVRWSVPRCAYKFTSPCSCTNMIASYVSIQSMHQFEMVKSQRNARKAQSRSHNYHAHG